MPMKNHYFITTEFMYMMGHYDRYGKLCTQIIETTRTFLVDMSPLEVLDMSIGAFGFDLKGAIATSRRLLGDIHMCPIKVNPINQIVVFPTKSPKHEDTIWFNPYHIERTTSIFRKTAVALSNGKTLIFPAKLSAFNSKLQTAEQYNKMTTGTPGGHFTMMIDSDNRPVKKVENGRRSI
ncbi:competence protein ComK [Bacillus sp. JJ1532]|uniref:competence protein ComK n=1 Tax=Bacillus sp. JJ1532 TaxID=3122958 RepID=UPI002FFF9073